MGSAKDQVACILDVPLQRSDCSHKSTIAKEKRSEKIEELHVDQPEKGGKDVVSR